MGSAIADNAFESAIDRVESLREEIVSGEESKRKQNILTKFILVW
ncbi:MAG: hypothetical protein RMY34_11645 [Aulosira sp. DedQUE10]|nr:hypothetical protein [Aulosira sp. DedQUE10]